MSFLSLPAILVGIPLHPDDLDSASEDKQLENDIAIAVCLGNVTRHIYARAQHAIG